MTTRTAHAEHVAGTIITEVSWWTEELDYPMPPGASPRFHHEVRFEQRVDNSILVSLTLYAGIYSANARRAFEEAASGAELLASTVATATR